MDSRTGLGTDQVGMALYSASGVVVFVLAEYGPGIDVAVLAAFAVVSMALLVVGAVSASLGWGVGLPVALVTAGLAVVRVIDPGPFSQRLSMFGALGVFVAITGALYLIVDR